MIFTCCGFGSWLQQLAERFSTPLIALQGRGKKVWISKNINKKKNRIVILHFANWSRKSPLLSVCVHFSLNFTKDRHIAFPSLVLLSFASSAGNFPDDPMLILNITLESMEDKRLSSWSISHALLNVPQRQFKGADTKVILYTYSTVDTGHILLTPLLSSLIWKLTNRKRKQEDE